MLPHFARQSVTATRHHLPYSSPRVAGVSVMAKKENHNLHLEFPVHQSLCKLAVLGG